MTGETLPPSGQERAGRAARSLGLVGLVLASVPAILALGLAVAAAVSARENGPKILAPRYQSAAEALARSGDFSTAALYLERASRLDPENPGARFALAKALAASGQPESAYALVRSLAPARGVGHPPAHVWLASQLLRARPLSPSRVAAAESHLLRVIKAVPDPGDAHHLLGELYAATGRPAEAEAHLSKVARERPQVLNLLSTVCARQGRNEAARHWAEEASREFKKRTEAAPSDELSRARWAAALSRLNDHEGAARALEAGLTLLASDFLRSEYGECMANRAAAIEDGPEAVGNRLAVLDRGLEIAPGHPRLLDLLAELLRDDGPVAEAAMRRMRGLLADGKAAVSAHFLLGVEAHRRGDTATAGTHFAQALRLSPRSPILANNLAWHLAEGNGADPERALAVIDSALEQSPNDPRFLGTRGHVLVRLKRWGEALHDLEAALKVGGPLPGLHEDLAATYRGLGLPDMAEAHEARALNAAGKSPDHGEAVPGH